MMKSIIRKAEAKWRGNLDNGHGFVSTQSLALSENEFRFKERIDEASKEPNPEELLAAASSSCFSMALSKTLQDENVIAVELRVRTNVTLSISDNGPKLTKLYVKVEGIVPNYSTGQFEKAVVVTAKNCPVLQLFQSGFESVEVEAVLLTT